MICPVIQELAGFNKNVARLATSSDWPTRPKGCLFPPASIFSGEFNSAPANGV